MKINKLTLQTNSGLSGTKTMNTEEMIAEMFKMKELEMSEFISRINRQIEADIEFILRNKIEKPIKGDITKGKLRWRGISGIAYSYDRRFLGVMQRDKVIGMDGEVKFSTPHMNLKLKGMYEKR